jgi:SAM-dependent methyltransferase
MELGAHLADQGEELRVRLAELFGNGAHPLTHNASFAWRQFIRWAMLRVMRFRCESLVEIRAWIEARRAAGAPIVLEALDPDHGRGRYAGERVEVDGETYIHRPLRVWLELGERLGLRLCTPRLLPPLVQLTFEPLDPAARLAPTDDEPTERYGAASEFARIDKLEEPVFLIDLEDALDRAALPSNPRVLDLGVNTGDELALIARRFPGATFVGVDHSASAIAVARSRFPDARFHVADLAHLATLDLGRFDLVISIGTLQSPGVEDREVLRQIMQQHLTERGAVIFGFPNCRYIDGELEHGTRMKNFRQPELGALFKDVGFYRRYLQQHRRKVFVTGRHYILVTGVVSSGA